MTALDGVDDAGLLKAVRAVSLKAAAAIMAVYQRDFTVDTKSDQSPLTEADVAAHGVITSGLEALTPHWPVLSEESQVVDFAERRHWRRFWLVDPLDGTKQFVRRNGEFTVNIALVEDGFPVLGLVHIPAQGRCYAAGPTLGALRWDDDGTPLPIAVTRPPATPLRVVGSRSHANPAVEAYLARLGAFELVPIGSALKFCLVAEGAADLYPRFGPTSEWDTAAAQCVVERAGGRVMDLSGQRLRYNQGESLLNPHFLVCGDGDRDWLTPLDALP
ncbi:MAG: 3'(2'),5'-bisphosphate nucleotidase CysQ [Candidatus Competibacterales bacterium]